VILVLAILFSSAAIFCMMVTDFSWENILVALALSGALMFMFRRQILPRPLPSTGLSLHLIIYAPVLFWYLFIDILKGTYQIITITLGVRPLRKPGIVKIPIGAHSAYGVGPVGYFITLSPGSFMVDIDWEEKMMLVHVVDASDPEAIRRDAEKYYRLWEYQHASAGEPADTNGEGNTGA
jgi:multicomponent Na+:H+ antiporter subunit E